MKNTPKCHSLELPDPGDNKTVTVQITCPGQPGRPRPLLILSHGSGGSGVLYPTLVGPLAQAGYVVACPEHPGNHRKDNSLVGTHQNLVNRPRHLRLVADAILGDARFSSLIAPDRIILIGHSMGACTALSLAGGQPWDKQGQPVEVEADPRVAALVLLAPAAAYFNAPGALSGVRQPILLLSAEHDPLTPRWHGELIRDGVPDPAQVDFEEIPGAGHFSFLSPFPAALRKPGFQPAEDPPGFDRENFHRVLPGRILGFLEAQP